VTTWRLEVFETLGSTSDLCAERAAAGEPDGLAVLALTQTQARGSRGRAWSSPPGNLALSVLLRDAGPLAEIGWLPLMAGVALIEALSPLVAEPLVAEPPLAEPLLADPGRLRLKWPNDVLLDGAKLAGILIEATGSGLLADTAVIGFGVNLATAPEVPGRVTACVAQAAVPPSPAAFARVLLERLGAWRARPRDAVRAAWLERTSPPGAELRVSLGGEVISGRFAGLDQHGRLLLDAPDGRRAIGAGEVMAPA
jgi:BirA family biotin operon repressor/biotin-[acetyl-CoA-carboxylase] ligase